MALSGDHFFRFSGHYEHHQSDDNFVISKVMNEKPPNFAHIFDIRLVLIKKIKIGPPAPLTPHFAPPRVSKRLFSGIFSEKPIFFQ